MKEEKWVVPFDVYSLVCVIVCHLVLLFEFIRSGEDLIFIACTVFSGVLYVLGAFLINDSYMKVSDTFRRRLPKRGVAKLPCIHLLLLIIVFARSIFSEGIKAKISGPLEVIALLVYLIVSLYILAVAYEFNFNHDEDSKDEDSQSKEIDGTDGKDGE